MSLLPLGPVCVCGHLSVEHLWIDKGKAAGTRGECMTRGPSGLLCCARYEEKP